jgi:ABC-2 type transport system ATP-binding protein
LGYPFFFAKISHLSDYRLKGRIGVLLQTTSIQPNMKVREALKLFASFYKNAPSVDDLPKMLSLEDKLGSRFKKLSGGLKQRVAIALALVNDPEILFLDELTTGLDPQSRRNMWDLVEEANSIRVIDNLAGRW